MSKILSGIIDKLENKPEYLEAKGGRITLTFFNDRELQEFLAEVRKNGVCYGLELAKITQDHTDVH